MHPQTLRMYETKGLVRPQRTPGGTRLYSEADVERLRIVQRLTTELGLNLAGVELVLRLEDELRKAHAQIERLQRAAAHGSAEGAQAVPPRPRARTRGAATGKAVERWTSTSSRSSPRRRSPPRRSSRAGTATPSSIPSISSSRSSTRSCRASSFPTPTRCARRPRRRSRRSRASRARSSSRSVSARVLEGARPRLRRGEEARGRVRRGAAPAARARRRPARRSCSRRSPRSRPAAASPRTIPRARTRRSRSSAAT